MRESGTAGNRRRAARTAGGCALTLALLGIFFYGAVAFRQWRLSQHIPMRMPGANWPDIGSPDPTLFWVNKPNLKDVLLEGVDDNGKPFQFRVSTNAVGLRGPAIGAKTKIRILAIGDSTTFGHGCDNDATWPVRLESILAGRGYDTEVINAGVCGYGAYQGLRYMELRGLALEPDLVLATFGINDSAYWDNVSDYERQRFSEAELQKLREERKGQRTQLNRLSQEEFIETLRRIRDLCGERGARFAFITWPALVDISPIGKMLRLPLPGDDDGSGRMHVRASWRYNIVHHAASLLNLPVIDLVPVLGRQPGAYIDSVHVNAAGNLIVAEAVAEAILEQGLLRK